MKFHRVIAVARKEWIHVLRDWRSLLLTLGTPVFLLVLFAYALTLDVDKVPLALMDQSNTQESRDISARFIDSGYFKLVGTSTNYRDLEKMIDNGTALIALVIPQDIELGSKSHSLKKVQIIVDGSDSNTATIALGYSEAIIGKLTEERITRFAREEGYRGNLNDIDLRSRVWYNPDMESKYTIVPGLIGVIMMVITSLMTSLTMAREWEKGTMETLITTPIRPFELIVGKMIPYFFIGLIDVIIVIAIGEFVFHVPMRGSLGLLFLFTTIFLVGALSLGMLISIITKSQLLASQLATVVTFLPSFLLSGFLSPIANMPLFIQMITLLVPARYLIHFLRSIYLKGEGIETLYIEALFLITFALMTFLFANMAFKKKMV
ncbi:ABC transporter permease [Estrella lausannensis]|uniref:ABC transmembrane type-2 domain-containing protein n=1 Tax=Estrella lausannensis TaxID=483423 RepID=A0A0H5E6F9_9BACT|nr:ABC transporter permease [Estrella lausannensis]CRX38865.1 conserved hypothetical protein [Estrella lausannensis]